MNPELVKFHLPTTDQFSVAVDTNHSRDLLDFSALVGATGRAVAVRSVTMPLLFDDSDRMM